LDSHPDHETAYLPGLETFYPRKGPKSRFVLPSSPSKINYFGLRSETWRLDCPEFFGFVFARGLVIVAPVGLLVVVAAQDNQLVDLIAVSGHPIAAKRMPGALGDPFLYAGAGVIIAVLSPEQGFVEWRNQANHVAALGLVLEQPCNRVARERDEPLVFGFCDRRGQCHLGIRETGKKQRLFFSSRELAQGECERLKTRKDNFGVSLGNLTSAQIVEAADCYEISLEQSFVAKNPRSTFR
jgi:hypothetical protein